MLAKLLEDQINWQDNISAGIGNGKKKMMGGKEG